MADNEDIKIRLPEYDQPTHSESGGPVTSAPRDAQAERRIRQIIEDAAQRNTALLTQLMDTEEAVNGLQNSEIQLLRAKEELEEQETTVRKLHFEVRERQSRYIRQRDSKSKKWYYRLTRMRRELEAKIQESERAFHDSAATQTQAEKRERELREDLDSTQAENNRLKQQASKHGAAHKEIDDLYSSIFSGPTPGFPDEDEQEAIFKVRNAEHKATVATLKATTKAYKQVEGIASAIARAMSENSRAEYESDSIFYLPEYATIFLERCNRLVDQGLTLAENTTDELPKPLDADVVQTHLNLQEALTSARQDATDGINATYLSRTELLQHVHRISSNLENASQAQKKFTEIIKALGRTAKQAVTLSSRELEDARQALHAIRQNAFEITVGFGAAAPPYNECCDRAVFFEGDAHAQCEGFSVPVIDERALPPPPSYERATG